MKNGKIKMENYGVAFGDILLIVSDSEHFNFPF